MSGRVDGRAKALAFVAEINRDELAVRLMERATGLKRTGKNKQSASEIMDEADEDWPPPCGRCPFRDMADIALGYLNECIKAGQRPS